MPRPRGSRAAALPAAVSSYAGDSREVIGPPSALLPNAAAFAQTVEDALKEAEKTLEQIKQEWAGMTPEEYARLNDRCRRVYGKILGSVARKNSLVEPHIQRRLLP